MGGHDSAEAWNAADRDVEIHGPGHRHCCSKCKFWDSWQGGCMEIVACIVCSNLVSCNGNAPSSNVLNRFSVLSQIQLENKSTARSLTRGTDNCSCAAVKVGKWALQHTLNLERETFLSVMCLSRV